MDNLYWQPHAGLHALLQSYGSSTQAPTLIQKQLDAQHEWLLNSLAFFRRPNGESRKLITGTQLSITLRGRKFAIDKLLVPATLKLSSLLDLDELQTHILLKRWVKEAGMQLQQGQPLELELEEMLQVLDYYHQERLLLLKSVQYILLQGVIEPLFAQTSSTLLRAGLENRLVSVLRANVEPPHTAAAGMGPKPGALSGHMAAVLKEFEGQQANMAWLSMVHTKLREQQLAERCELTSSLLLLYEVMGVQCGSARAHELTHILSGVALAWAAGGLATHAGDQAAVALVAEQLSCTLILSVIDLPACIDLARKQTPPASMSADMLPLGNKLHDVHSRIRSWPGNPASALLLLTWGGLAQLLEPYVSLGEGVTEEMQGRAQEAGLFQSAAVALEACLGLMSTAVAQLCRGVALKALCVCATAFELGPTRQDPTSFASLLQLLQLVVADDAQVCTEVWDEERVLLAPLRAIVLDACTLFPAEPGPYLQLLGVLGHGSVAASAAYTHLQVFPLLTCVHPAGDPTLQRIGPDAVVLAVSTMWAQAPSVTTLALPAGIEGQLLPWPAALSDQGTSRCLLVRWDVNSTIKSFGQLLMLGRAAHCLLQLRSCFTASSAPSDPRLVLELGDALGLIARLAHDHPDIAPDLMAQSVDVAEAQGGPLRKWSWLDVAARGVELYSGLLTTVHAQGCCADIPATRLLSHTVDSIRLLQSLSFFFPERVLAALQSLPLLAAQLPPSALGASGPTVAAAGMEDGPPGTFPLAELPRLEADARVLVGIMPQLRAFQQQCEACQGSYPVTSALLDLASSLLERGYATGFVSGMVLFGLNEMLPGHHRWQFKAAASRWDMSAALLKVLHQAITSGTHMAGASGPLPLPTESVGASAGAATPAAPPALVPVHVSELAGTVLQLLLFHGATLLFHVLPPPMEALDALRAMDAQNPELLACEGALAALLQLLPVLLAGAEAYQQQELPFEVFVFHGLPSGQPPPATSLCAFVAYEQPEQEGASTASLSFLALRLVRSLQASVSRLFRFQPTTHLPSTIMPKDGTTQAALVELFRADIARARPTHFALAVEVLEAAVAEHPGLCASLLPSPPAADGARDTQRDQAELAGGANEGSRAPLPPSAQRSVLDGLLELMRSSRELRQEAPQVLCALMRALCCFWQPHAALQPPSAQLRLSPDLWACLEECVARGVADMKAWQPTDDPWLQLSEAFAWQILLLEAFALSRSQKAGAAADANGARSKELTSLLDRLKLGGTLHKAAMHYADLRLSQDAARRLWAAVQALYLELGACAVVGGFGSASLAAVPALDGGASVEDRTAMAPEIKQELGQVVHALRAGSCTLEDIEDAHRELLRLATLPAQQQQRDAAASSPPTSPAPVASPISLEGSPLIRSPGSPLATAPAQRLQTLLLTHPLGAAVLRRGLSSPLLPHKPASYGPAYLLDPCSLPPLLGPLAQHVAAADLTADSMAEVSRGASLAHARLASLQSVTALVSVLPTLEGATKGTSALTPATGKGPVSEAVAVAVASISSLGAWASSDLSRICHAPWSGLRTLLHSAEQAALAATHMAMHALNHARAAHKATRAQHPPAAEAPQASQLRISAAPGLQTPPPRPRVLNARAAAPPPHPLQLQLDTGRPRAQDQQGSTAAAISPWDCQQLATLLNTWLRLGPRAVGIMSSAVLAQIADNLATSLLTALQLYGEHICSTGPQLADHLGLQTVLLDLLPQLSRAASSGAVNTMQGTQVMLEMVTRQLPAADWLPVMQAHLNLQAMLVQAASQVPVAVAGAGADVRGAAFEQEGAWSGGQGKSLGMLQLALAVAVARVPEGARWMSDCGVLDFLHVMARQLLAADGAGLAPLPMRLDLPVRAGEAAPSPLTRPFMPDPASPAAAPTPAPEPSAAGPLGGPNAPLQLTGGAALVAAQPPGLEAGAAAAWPGTGARTDTACAYTGPLRMWSPPHQQWCVLLSFASALLRSLGQYVDVEAGSIDFLAGVESRLLMMCLPPAGDAAQPLTLAGLFELERVLFLLCHLARYAGTWHFSLPGSLPKFRTAVTSFLAFAAKADSTRPVTLECPPQCAQEQEMAAQPSSKPCTKGWFRVCALGASNPGELAPSTPGGNPTRTTAAASGRGGSPLALPSGTPTASPLSGLFGGLQDAADDSAQAGTPCSSQFSERLAESMYTCVLHACLFLRATAPQVSEGEASHLVGTWPRPRDLMLLEEQTLDVLYSLRGGEEVHAHEPRHARTCMTLIKTLHLLCDFVDVVGCPAPRRVWHGELREHLGVIEGALLRKEPLPHLATLFSSTAAGMSHSGSLALPTQSGTLSLSM